MVKVVDRIASAQMLLIKKIAAETARLIKEEGAAIVNLSQVHPQIALTVSS